MNEAQLPATWGGDWKPVLQGQLANGRRGSLRGSAAGHLGSLPSLAAASWTGKDSPLFAAAMGPGAVVGPGLALQRAGRRAILQGTAAGRGGHWGEKRQSETGQVGGGELPLPGAGAGSVVFSSCIGAVQGKENPPSSSWVLETAGAEAGSPQATRADSHLGPACRGVTDGGS